MIKKLVLENISYDDHFLIVKTIKEELGNHNVKIHYNGNHIYGDVTITPLNVRENWIEDYVLRIINDFYQKQKLEV